METPLGTNPLHPNVVSSPVVRIYQDDVLRLGKKDKFPYVGTTYRLTEHFHTWTKHARLNAIAQPEQFVEISENLAKAKGIANGDRVKVSSQRGFIRAVAVVTRRLQTLNVLKDMGANSVAMGVSEVYSGMQTGVIDGAENNPPTFIAHNYMPVAKNYTLSGHFITPEMLLYSKVKWDKLSADEQQKVLTLAREAQFEQRKLWQAYNQQALEKMKAGGVQFHDIDKTFFVKATEPVRAQYGDKHQDLMKAIADVQ
jgi:hypothetical protein